MERTLAILLFTGLACGGSSGGLNPAFAKTWVGTSTATITGLQPFTSAGQLTVAVNGDTAHVTGVCPPDGAGAIDAKGSGNSASWSGSMACPPIPQTGVNCSITPTFTAATMTLSADGHTLNASGTGTVTGCNLNTTFTLAFQGT